MILDGILTMGKKFPFNQLFLKDRSGLGARECHFGCHFFSTFLFPKASHEKETLTQFIGGGSRKGKQEAARNSRII